MSLRAPKDTAESLRLTLQRLEQDADPAHDTEAKAELKRILLLRIADLEAFEALKLNARRDPAPTSQSAGILSPALPDPLTAAQLSDPAIGPPDPDGSSKILPS